MATKKSPGTAVILWEAEMKAAAVKQAAGEKVWGEGGIGRININGGVMMIDGEAVEGNSLDVVVLAATPLNEYYDSPYTPGRPTVPACYAYGDPNADDPEDGMAPGEVEDKQGDDNGLCAGCWANQMGSADVGRGKACKNVRRMLLVTEDALEGAEALSGAEVRSLSVPVMSVKHWAKYVKEVLADELGRPCYGVVTTVSVAPDPKSQFVIKFAFKELINFDQPLWEAMKAKTTAALKDVIAPFPKQSDLDAAQASKAPAPRGRAAPQAAKGTPAPGKAAPGKPAPGKAAPAKKTGKY